MKTFTVEIPVPPSLNNVYANARRRGSARVFSIVGGKVVAKTKSGASRVLKPGPKLWKHGAVTLIKSQVRMSERIAGPVDIHITVPAGTLGDIDNRVKLAVDALVMSERIDDDRNLGRCIIERGDVKGIARITVTGLEGV